MLLQREYFSLDELVKYWQEKHDNNIEALDFLHAANRGEFSIYMNTFFITRRLREKGFVSKVFDGPDCILPSIIKDKDLKREADLPPCDPSDRFGFCRAYSDPLPPSDEMHKHPPELPLPVSGHPFFYKVVWLDGIIEQQTISPNERFFLYEIEDADGKAAHVRVFLFPKEFEIAYKADIKDLYLYGSEILPIENDLFRSSKKSSSSKNEISVKTMLLILAILKKELMEKTATTKQSFLIDDIIHEYGDLKGVSKSTLEAIFAEANREEKKRL